MKNWITNNLWIKIASLALAIITWFYVNGELRKETERYYKVHDYETSETRPPLQKSP